MRKSASVADTIPLYDGFNGAATLSLRKLTILRNGIKEFSSLQWGRNFIVAEMNEGEVINEWGDALQWGRNFIVAEIRQPY